MRVKLPQKQRKKLLVSVNYKAYYVNYFLARKSYQMKCTRLFSYEIGPVGLYVQMGNTAVKTHTVATFHTISLNGTPHISLDCLGIGPSLNVCMANGK